jgi:Na+-transporting methylmalonyl-CoA/oxaloacetate decarboxylase gamma subunit
MTNQVLSVVMTFGERAAYAGKMFVIGVGTVFTVLAILWGALVIFRRLVTKEPTASTQPAPAPAPAPAAAPAQPAPVAPPATSVGNDALIAVITAAVAAAMAEENGGVSPNFRVVSFRKL